MMKTTLLLLTLICASCATTNNDVLDVQQKLLADKYIKNNTYYFRFYDGSVLAVDEATYHQFKEKTVVKLTWRKK